MIYFENFWTPSISRGRLKLETSNLACRLETAVLTKKMQNLVKKLVKGSRDLLLEFWDPLNIARTVKARNLKFGMHIGHKGR